MDINKNVLVKYCFTELKGEIPEDKAEYYSKIIMELDREGVINDICKYMNEASLFHGEEIEMIYRLEAGDKYCYTFSCNETRGDKTYTFEFTIKFLFETHDVAEILYVEIFSKDYNLSNLSNSNCLEILKHRLRGKIKEWKNRYCLFDKQSAFYAARLYPLIHEIENFFRYYVNDVFIKIFGSDWWNKAIATNIKKNRKERIEDTREYAGAYKDIQPYLLSLELGDLMTIAHTKQLKWNPVYDIKIENFLNYYSGEDLVALLKQQCQVELDIWGMCFKKHLGEEFETNYRLFEKRRNQVAHNKLLDSDAYKNMSDLCNEVMNELMSAHEKFCSEFISEEEREMIEEYKANLEYQKELELDSLKASAEEESGVKVYTYNQIIGLLNDALFSLYNDLLEIFSDRQDFDFDEFTKVVDIGNKQKPFKLKHLVTGKIINISAELDINDSPGDISTIMLGCQMGDGDEKWNIHFTNGEYSFHEEQTSYMPERYDELDENSIEETKQGLCDFIEENFPNLREEADIYNHLEAMGKAQAITENDVYCWDCEEEYICINDEFAPTGTCLNCGARNFIIYCTYCQCPIEAMDIEIKDKEIHYCSYCNDKLFGND